MIKVIYKNSNNISTEASVFTAAESVSSYSPSGINVPVLTGSDGKIDSSLIPAVAAALLQEVKIASEAITIGDVVYAVDDTHVGLAQFNSTQAKATVHGVAISNAAIGENVLVVLMGRIVNSIYNIFPVNKILYVDIDGGITDVRQTNGYLTPIGRSLGGGAIMVQVGYPSRVL